jgi:hypothetical protein
VALPRNEHPRDRGPETAIGTQSRPPRRGQLVQPSASVPGAAHQTVALAPSQSIVKDHLGRRLLTQAADLASGAPVAKRATMHRIKHRELDVA